MANIQGIYIALFGRPADPAGLAYFNEVTNNGADLSKIGDLANTDEYKSRFNGMSNEEIVNTIYKSLFGRDAEPDGLAFFANGLKDGTFNINNIAISILDGAQGSDKTIIDGKIAAADLFTSHLDLSVEIAAYNGNSAAEIGREYIESITTNNPGTGENADAAILRLLNQGGQAPADNVGGGVSGGGVTDEATYSGGDLFLLKNTAIKETYKYADYSEETDIPLQQLGKAVQDALHDAAPAGEGQALNGNTILVKNLSPITELYGDTIDKVTSVVAKLLPSYDGWSPDTLFVGIPGEDSSVKGTSGNDVALFIDGNQSNHTVTGGRGNDVLVVASLDGISVPVPALVTPSELDAPLTIGKHVIDGGSGDDIVINVGGDHNVLTGGAGSDVIVSVGDARDTIQGGSGDDYIFGGSDQGIVPVVMALSEEGPVFAEPEWANGDKLTGGTGKDTFLYLPEGRINESGSGFSGGPFGNITSNGADTITDFKTTEDKIGIFVEHSVDITYTENTGYASFDEAAAAADTSFQVETGDKIQAFFAANVEGNGYLFVDDNGNGSIDFVIKLQGLTSLSAFDASDINAIDVSSIIETVGNVLNGDTTFTMGV